MQSNPNLPTLNVAAGGPPSPTVPPRTTGLIERQVQSLAILLLLSILPTLWRSSQFAPLPTPKGGAGSADSSGEPLGLDPNTAPWWELATLPGIGETLARRICEFRDEIKADSPDPKDVAVFRTPEDLMQVRGIGPAKLDRMRRHLSFPPTRLP